MADIFSVSPPAWLQQLALSHEPQFGKFLGSFAAGLQRAGGIAAEKGQEQKSRGEDPSLLDNLGNYFGSISQGYTEAKMTQADPMWRMKARALDLHNKQSVLQSQKIQSQLDLTDLKSTQMIADQQELPRWLAEHPTWESRQDAQPPTLLTHEAQSAYRNISLSDAQSSKKSGAVEAIKSFSSRVNELSKADPEAAGKFLPFVGKNPSDDINQALGLALEAVKLRKENEVSAAKLAAEARGETPETKITEKGVTQTYKASGASDTRPIIESQSVDGKKVWLVRNPKTGHFQILNNKDATQAKTIQFKLTSVEARLKRLEDKKAARSPTEDREYDRLSSERIGLQAQLQSLAETLSSAPAAAPGAATSTGLKYSIIPAP